MSVRVIVGDSKAKALKEIAEKEPFAVVLPNLNPSPSMAQQCLERLRNVFQGEDVYITTDNPSLVDYCLLDEILIAKQNFPQHFPLSGDYLRRVKASYDAGIQSVSEILICEGLWD